AIQFALPATIVTLKFQPVTFAINGNVVDHEFPLHRNNLGFPEDVTNVFTPTLLSARPVSSLTISPGNRRSRSHCEKPHSRQKKQDQARQKRPPQLLLLQSLNRGGRSWLPSRAARRETRYAVCRLENQDRSRFGERARCWF